MTMTMDLRARFPAMAHLEGTARVSPLVRGAGGGDEPWLHALLRAVGRRTRLAALISTSLNRRGRPITSSALECLAMYDTSAELDYLLIEDWSFRKERSRMS